MGLKERDGKRDRKRGMRGKVRERDGESLREKNKDGDCRVED